MEIDGVVRRKVVKYQTKIEIRVDVTMTGECQRVLFPFLVVSQIKASRRVGDQLFRQRVYYGDLVLISAVYAVVKQ